jgi:hypothetical protein
MPPTQTQEKQRVIRAINDLGRKVSVADVSAKTGLPILVTASQLNKVAAETNGHLQVSTTGDIAYQFNFGFQNAYLAQGVRRFLQDVLAKCFQIGFFLVRISFGVMLIISLLIIVMLFIAVMFSMSRGDDRDDRRGFRFDFFDYLILRDLFLWNAYSYPAASYQGDGRYGVRAAVPKRKSNFLYNCFSFLFGDGNPNQALQDTRWQLVAQVIRNHGGVVTAEQLAPYTDADPKNEDGVLPVLVRFDGRPEVTETGNIVYLFPSLQVSASNFKESSTPAFLREVPWPFSKLSIEELIPVIFLATINLIGSWGLCIEAAKIPTLFHLWPLLAVLVVYGTMFVMVPLIRWFVIGLLNSRINERNQLRKQWSEQVAQPDDALKTKLLEVGPFKTKLKEITAADVIYDTDKDMLEQTFENQPKRLREKSG